VDIGLRGPKWNGENIMCEIMEKLTTEARDEGMTQGTLKTLFSLVQDGVITISEAAKRADMTEVIFKEKTQRFKS
jgi:Tfp pilus assembly ATPase PilU